jgi:hypothetical protein
MIESIYNVIEANDVFEDNINKYIKVKTEETIKEINIDTYKGTYCDSNNKCLGDKFFIDISNNIINSNISATSLNVFPKLNNNDITNYLNQDLNSDINLNYLYPINTNKYVYYDLSNNNIKNIVKGITNGSDPRSFYRNAPYTFTKNIISDESPIFLENYMIRFNNIPDNTTHIKQRMIDSSGIIIKIPDEYNTVWFKVINATSTDISNNNIQSFRVKTINNKYLGTYSNNSLKYMSLLPNGNYFNNLPFTWIPVYTGVYKEIVVDGDLFIGSNIDNTIINKNKNRIINITNNSLNNFNGFIGIAFTQNPYNHIKQSSFSLFNPNALRFYSVDNYAMNLDISGNGYFNIKMDISSTKIDTKLKYKNIFETEENIVNTNGFVLNITPSQNNFLAHFNIPIIIKSQPKLIYFWFDRNIPDNILKLKLYDNNSNTPTLKMKSYPILSFNSFNIIPSEYFKLEFMYYSIIPLEDLIEYYKSSSNRKLFNNFGYLGICIDTSKLLTNKGSSLFLYPSETSSIGLYEIGSIDYYDMIKL